jgi:putative PIN family toxin of toxin-antitoxin system
MVLLDKFSWNESKLDQVLSVLWSKGEMVVPAHRVDAVGDDPDDNRILECAESANADVVVSGDRHLLRLGSYKSIPIISPRELIDRIA